MKNLGQMMKQAQAMQERMAEMQASLERVENFTEKCLDHILGFTFVEPNLLKQEFGQFRLGQCGEFFFSTITGLRGHDGPAQIGGKNGFQFGRITLIHDVFGAA